MAGHWLFVCNPDRWDIWSYLADGNGMRDFGWSVKRYLEEIEPGDDAALWITGKHRGVYAIGRVTGSPTPDHGDEYWTDPDEEMETRHFAALDLGAGLFGDPVLASDLATDPRFTEATVLTQPWAAVPHRLTGDQWLAITDRVEGR